MLELQEKRYSEKAILNTEAESQMLQEPGVSKAAIKPRSFHQHRSS